MAATPRTIFCELGPQKPELPARRLRSPVPSLEGGKILLQPRLCTLRSYGSGEGKALIRTTPPRGEAGVSHFFDSLAKYVESTKRSQDFEIVSGRLAMIAFASAVSIEVVTGNSLFKKLELQQIAEAGGVCVVVIASAAAFAWFSSARTRISQILTVSCNSFVDTLIDNIVDSLFYESEQSDWSEEV